MSRLHAFVMVAAILFSLILPSSSSASESMSFLEKMDKDDLERFPEPIPVVTVGRASQVPRIDPALEAPAAANEAVRVSLLDSRFEKRVLGKDAPDGHVFLVVQTRWENIHPKRRVDKAKLEGKVDRTMGAGGLASGDRLAKDREYVHMDVAYKVPRTADHLYAVVDGIAVPLHELTVDLPGGVAPSDGFSIAKHGQLRDMGLAFLVPEETRHAAMQFFDYTYGSIVLPIRGDIEPARDPERLIEASLSKAETTLLELFTIGVDIRETYSGEPAPPGHRWALVEFAGRSRSKDRRGRGDIVQLDPTKNLWFVTDGGYVNYATAGSMDERGIIRFTPEVFQRQEAAALVPEGTERLRMGLRVKNDVVELGLTQDEPTGPPRVLQTHVDGDTMEVLLFGQVAEGGIHILDLGVRPLTKGKGLEIQPAQQFFLVTEDGEMKMDTAATGRLEHGLSDRFVVPPGTPVRFELAFDTPNRAKEVRVRGFRSEGRLGLDAGTGAARPMAADPAPGPIEEEDETALMKRDITPVESERGAPASPDHEDRAPGVAPETLEVESMREERSRARLERPVRPPLQIEEADFDAPSVAVVGDPAPTAFEDAFLLKEPWTVRGRLDNRETHYFELSVDGPPQLWHMEATGDNLSFVQYLNPGGKSRQRRNADRDTGKAVLTGLFLSPGSHWFSLTAARADAAGYTFRAVPLGQPDSHAEQEPNDDITRAGRIGFDFPRTGYIYEPDDVDCYRFSLAATEHLILTVEPPDDIHIRMDLYEVYAGGRTNRITSGRALEAGDPLTYQALLPAGDYLVELKPGQSGERSDLPYTLLLKRRSPFDFPPDLEPNDSPEQARPLPPDFILSGDVGRFGGEDWYEIPGIEQETTLFIKVTKEPERLRLSIHEDGSTRASRRLEWDREEEVHRAVLTPETTFHLRVSGRGDYGMNVSFDPGPAPSPEGGSLHVELSTGASPTVVAAYWPEAQRVEVPVHIRNRDDKDKELSLELASSDLDWKPVFENNSVALEPDETLKIPMSVHIPPDARADDPVRIEVMARGQKGGSTSAAHNLVARCEATPSNPLQSRPLPPELLGGINIAWTALGAQPIGPDERETRRILPLFDGYTPLDCGWNRSARELPAEFTVRLAGENPIPIAGVALHPLASALQPDHQLKEFDVAVSEDGESFQEVLKGELDRRTVEQAFVFDQPVEAKYARLRLHSNHAGNKGRIGMGQWKVIARPGETVSPGTPFNVAALELGGHVVWADPTPRSYSVLSGMLTEEQTEETIRPQESQPLHWVIAFNQQRAALITEIQWVDAPDDARGNRLENVTVAVSMDSPLGPWKELERWKIKRTAEGVKPLVFPEPVWARYLLFSSTDPDERDYWQYPRTLRVIEHPVDESYRSILAEWGHYSRDAVYEMLEPRPQEPFVASHDLHGTRANARPLEQGEAYPGSVRIGEKEEWHRIDVPSDANLLTIRLTGRPTLRIDAILEDEAGEHVSVNESSVSPRERLVRAEVDPGASYLLRIYEPPRSVVFAWDNSGSMGPYRATVYQALQRFVEEVRPGLEYANFLPFQDGVPKLLHPEWSDQSPLLQRTLTNYHRQDSSSAGDTNLLAATKALKDRPGAKAILFLTDAQFGRRQSEKLWNALRDVRPQIFTVELHSGRNPPYHQQLMRSWAAVNAGHYTPFRTQADVEAAFDRAACYLRRPAVYTVTASASFEEPPEPEMYDILIEEGRVVTHGIFFDIDSATLRPESYPVLRQIGEMLRDHPELMLMIEGHTDNTGSAAWNQKLSERRAASVRAFLIERYGIDGARLDSVGYGEDRPADTNETPEGRQNNRRVELVKMGP